MLVDRFPIRREEDQEEDQILFPSYHEAGYFDRIADVPDLCTALPVLKSISEASLHTEPTGTVADDTAIRKEPSGHVDYLSHDWTEDDLSTSWRSIVTKQAIHSNSRRLENASWRAWVKAKYRLKTVAPETLSWRKDSDVTWLYGPLHKGRTHTQAQRSSSSGSSGASTPDSYQVQRPILKKRTLAETLLQRSFSACSISPQTPCTQTPNGIPASGVASKSISVQPGQYYSDFTLNTEFSGVQTPATAERRRIQFNDSVEQRIALDLAHEPESVKLSCAIYEEEEEDDDDFSSEDDTTSLTLSTSSFSPVSRKPATRNPAFLTTRSKTIAFLPSTTLKTHEGSASTSHRPPLSRGKPFNAKPQPEVVPSPPAPTKVSTPSKYFVRDIDEDSIRTDLFWEPEDIPTYGNARHGVELVPTLATALDPYEAFKVPPTSYGACMHYDEDEHALLMELGCV